MRYLMLICDGMDDEALPELGGRTPMEAAPTPCMDALAARGWTSTLANCPPELPPGSDTAIMTLLGADPRLHYTGRGALEAADAGLTPPPGTMAVRASFVRLCGQRDNPRFLPAGSLPRQDAVAAAEVLMRDPGFRAILEAGQCRLTMLASAGLLALLPSLQEELNPPHSHPGEAVSPLLPQNPCLRQLTLASMELLARENLALWFWGAGTAPELPPFPCPAVLISATPVARGLGRLVGMEVPRIPGSNGTPDTDYAAKAAAAMAAWDRSIPFVAVHVEAPDYCSHAGDPVGKAEAIARIDRDILAPCMDYLTRSGEPWRVLVLSDHRTECRTGGHTAAPVPCILCSSTDSRPTGDTALELLLGHKPR